MRRLFDICTTALWLSIKAFSLTLPALLVYIVLTQPTIVMNRGVPIVSVSDDKKVHDILPNSRWSDMKPCGEFFDEREEFKKALSCVNKNVWDEDPLKLDSTQIPRCFIVSASSPDVFSTEDKVFNFIPVSDGFRIGAVVGVYQPETRTVFIVENVDAAMIYRHELQHFFLHEHRPSTRGGGHHQKIWQRCEPPYYNPSEKAKSIATVQTK